jgi:hypothetical protein
MKSIRLAFLLCASFCSCAWAQTPAKAVKAVASAAKPTSKQPVPDEPASPEALGIAQRVHLGSLPCELGATVHLSHDPAAPGYFHVSGKGFRYRMKPVSTTTGAIRLEDTQAGAVWLQLANKSMLMDQKNGRRVADECAHPDQVAFAKDMVNNPPPALIDTTGMGR